MNGTVMSNSVKRLHIPSGCINSPDMERESWKYILIFLHLTFSCKQLSSQCFKYLYLGALHQHVAIYNVQLFFSSLGITFCT